MEHLLSNHKESNTQDQTSWTDFVGKGIKLRAQFRLEHPNLDNMPLKTQYELWAQYCELTVPVSPSMENKWLEASCLHCKDSKWIHPFAGNKPDYSQVKPCPVCNSNEEKMAEWELKRMGIPQAKRQITFDSFKDLPGAADAKKAAMYVVTGDAPPLLLIYGDHGNGKTHLAMAACLEAKERGKRVRFWHFGELITELQKAMNNDGNPGEILEDLKTCDFLVLDEIGFNSRFREHGTQWQEGVLEELINHHYAHELPLICTTNKDLKELPPAVLSRFRDPQVSMMIHNSASDYRARKPAKSGR